MSGVDWVAVLGSVTTVVAFVAFVAIVAWAWSGRRKHAFDAAANAPFALPDEGSEAGRARGEGGRQRGAGR